MKPIAGKAEVALEYPDKFYVGTFERTGNLDAHVDETGISLSLHHLGGEDVRKSVRMHFDYALFAQILRSLAKTVATQPRADIEHREALRDAARALYIALKAEAARHKDGDVGKMTPEEEVLLLHVLE